MSWQPDIQKLIQQLDAANKKIDEYIEQIASLFAELKLYRDSICDSCKENVLHATALTSATAATTWRNTLAPTPLESRLPVRPHVVETRSKLSSPLTLSPSGSSPTHSDDSFHTASQSSQDPLNTSPQLPSPIIIAPIISVDYNPEIEQTIDLSVVNIFTLPSPVRAVKFSRDGKYLAVGLVNGDAHIYDMMTMSKSVLVESGDSVIYSEAAVASKGRSVLRTIPFSPDNKYIATGRDGQIKIWEIKRKRVRAVFEGHRRYALCTDFSPNGRFLASASFDGTIRVWCIRDGSLKYPPLTIEDYFLSVAFSPNGRYLAGGSDDYCLRIWNSRTGQLLQKWAVETFRVWSVAFQPDGKRMASGGNDSAWRSWDLSSLQIRDLRSSGHIVDDEPVKEVFTCRGHEATVNSISFSPDGQWVVTSADNHSKLWDAITGVWVCTLGGHRDCVWQADFSPAGQYVVTGSTDCQVILWRYSKVDE